MLEISEPELTLFRKITLYEMANVDYYGEPKARRHKLSLGALRIFLNQAKDFWNDGNPFYCREASLFYIHRVIDPDSPCHPQDLQPYLDLLNGLVDIEQRKESVWLADHLKFEIKGKIQSQMNFWIQRAKLIDGIVNRFYDERIKSSCSQIAGKFRWLKSVPIFYPDDLSFEAPYFFDKYLGKSSSV